MTDIQYFRFQNTLASLAECAVSLDNIGCDIDRLSEDERKAAINIVKLCKVISDEYNQKDVN